MFFFSNLTYFFTKPFFNVTCESRLFFSFTLLFFFESLIYYLFLIICVLLMVALFTLSERKVMGAMQRRLGPNVVGFWGFLQPIADGMKVFFKEIIIPSAANKHLFIFAPYVSFVLSLLGWLIIPLFPVYTHIALNNLYNYNTLFLKAYFPTFFDIYQELILIQFNSLFFFFNID